MEEPSKPCPSSKVSSSNSLIGTEKCCQIPIKSINLKSTISAPFSLANSTTCFGVIKFLLSGGYVNKLLECLFAGFSGSDSDYCFYRSHKYLAVTNTAGFGSFLDRFDNFGKNVICDNDFELDLGDEIHHVFSTTIKFRVA